MFGPGAACFTHSEMRGRKESDTEHSWNQTNNVSIGNCNERTFFFSFKSVAAKTRNKLAGKREKYFLFLKKAQVTWSHLSRYPV